LGVGISSLQNWKNTLIFLSVSFGHCGDLISIADQTKEEKIYENPADESRAPELWTNQNIWLKVEKLLYVQKEAFTTLRQYLRELSTEEKGTTEY
jgi:hypothetical protein